MEDTKKKSKKWIWILCILIIIAVIGIILFVKLGRKKKDSDFNPNLDPNAGAISDNMDMEEPEGIRIPGYPSITIKAGEEKVKMNLMNPENNPCYFTFEIVLNETGETIYTSKMVEPGKAITNVTLNRALEKGEYEATIKITTASLEDGSAMNGANVQTTLIAE